MCKLNIEDIRNMVAECVNRIVENIDNGFNIFKEKFDTYLNEVINDASAFLQPYGLQIIIDSNYNFRGKRWLAVYEARSGMIREGKIVIGINYQLLYTEMKNRGISDDDFNIKAQARITFMHEVGHGIVDYLNSNGLARISSKKEEALVEEFGEYFFPEATYVYESELIDTLEKIKNI